MIYRIRTSQEPMPVFNKDGPFDVLAPARDFSTKPLFSSCQFSCYDQDSKCVPPTRMKILERLNLKSNDPDSWYQRFEAGEDSAAEELVNVYYDRLVRFARQRMAAMPVQIADDEGAVISALRSFFSGVKNGQFSRLDDDYDLWRVLATITARKAIRQMRVHWKKSGEADQLDRGRNIEQLLSPDPTPADQVSMLEEFNRQLDGLDDATLRKIVMMRLEGYDTSEIAEHLALHVRSVQRKLKLVQSQWLDELNDS